MPRNYLKLSAASWRNLLSAGGLRIADVPRLHLAAAPIRSFLARLQSVLTTGVQVHDAPVVILGYWRSGTTLLHELLATDPGFCYPTTHDCMNPHNFVLGQRFANLRTGAIRRPQDEMPLTWASPQEDEFALFALGARSPYEGLIVPSRYQEAQALGDVGRLSPGAKRKWERIFVSFLRNVTAKGGGRPVVLKSPAHGYRVSVIRRLFPNARFILITRNPYEILESMTGTCRAFMEIFGLGAPLADDKLREIVLAERMRFENTLYEGIAGLPESQFASIRFEDLIADAPGCIESIYRKLQLGEPKRARARATAEMQTRRHYRAKAGLPDQIWCQRIQEAWQMLFWRYGYSTELPASSQGRTEHVPDRSDAA
jgi:hypothetical protein